MNISALAKGQLFAPKNQGALSFWSVLMSLSQETVSVAQEYKEDVITHVENEK